MTLDALHLLRVDLFSFALLAGDPFYTLGFIHTGNLHSTWSCKHIAAFAKVLNITTIIFQDFLQ